VSEKGGNYAVLVLQPSINISTLVEIQEAAHEEKKGHLSSQLGGVLEGGNVPNQDVRKSENTSYLVVRGAWSEAVWS